MRTVFIVHDCAGQRSSVAVDRFSGAPLLRLHHYEQLKRVCFGWGVPTQRQLHNDRSEWKADRQRRRC